MAKNSKVFKFSAEASEPGSLHGNSYLIHRLTQSGKLQEYTGFAQRFPNGQLGEKFAQWLSKLQPAAVNQLVDRFQTLTHPQELTQDLYQDRTSIWKSLFDLATRGSGKGEVLISWLIKGTSMNGGTEPYDLDIQGEKYEVKDWSLQGNSAILAGVKSKVTNFHFWNEITDTIRMLEKLTLPALASLSPQAHTLGEKILQRRASIMSGECGQRDLQNLQKFYQAVHEIHSPATGYTTVILRGPNQPPVHFSIQDLPPHLLSSLPIKPIPHDPTLYTLTELRRLQYVREPHLLAVHMQQAVDKIVAGVTYIVFRKDHIRITRHFKPSAITISSLKFTEDTTTLSKNNHFYINPTLIN